MDLGRDYFTLFDTPADYELDLALLGERYRDLQREFHPDRFVDKSQSEQWRAVQTASIINDAYETLKSPLLRARYLLELCGRQDVSETTTIRDHDFLMQQIDLREQISEIEGAADPYDLCNTLEIEIQSQLIVQQGLFLQEYRVGDLEKAEIAVDKMQFFSKLLSQLESIEETLGD